MKSPKIFYLHINYATQVVVEDTATYPDIEQSVVQATLSHLHNRASDERIFKIADSNQKRALHAEYSETIFLDDERNPHNQPTSWLNSLSKILGIKSQVGFFHLDDVGHWEILIRQYNELVNHFGPAFAEASDFPVIKEYEEANTFDIIRLILDSEKLRREDRLNGTLKNRRDYFLLRYPKLREAITDLRLKESEISGG